VLTAKTARELEPALASLPAENAGTTSAIAAVSGPIRRRGAWRVPRILKVESAFGRVRLDLSRAVIEHPVVRAPTPTLTLAVTPARAAASVTMTTSVSAVSFRVSP
jgi:hypothetical protein